MLSSSDNGTVEVEGAPGLWHLGVTDQTPGTKENSLGAGEPWALWLGGKDRAAQVMPDMKDDSSWD